eukprot:3937416-Rhodomonas_salina.2
MKVHRYPEALRAGERILEGEDVWRPPRVLRASYAMSGTEIAGGPVPGYGHSVRTGPAFLVL